MFYLLTLRVHMTLIDVAAALNLWVRGQRLDFTFPMEMKVKLVNSLQ